jgi:hypothetical protein
MRRLVIIPLLLCLFVPASARADTGVDKLLRDACFDEHVSGHYTQRQYKKALERLDADADEYTACRQVLESARLATLGGSRGGGSGGGSTGGRGGGGGGAPAVARGADALKRASPAQREAIAKATKTAAPVEIGGELVRPGALGLGGLSGSEHGLPASLVALIVLLALTAFGGGGWWLWTRVLGRRLA